MKLLYPEFLYALSALIIPIIIHLFNFRKYKVIQFSQVRFLKDIQQQTKSTSKLKHLLILLSRLLAITFLVIAFCQPYLKTSDGIPERNKKGVSIYIDNSFSMQAKAESGKLLDLAKNKSLDILAAYKASDRFQLLTNDMTAEQQHWLNKDEFTTQLLKVDISPISKQLSEILVRQNALLEESDQNLSSAKFIISDLQENFFDWKNIKDSSQVNLIPLIAEKQENVSLDSLAFSKPYRSIENEETISFLTRNHNLDDKAQVSVKLQLNKKLKAPLQIDIKANDTASGLVTYRNSKNTWQNGILSLQDYPISFDDTLYFSYPLLTNVKVLHLYQKNPSTAITKLFENDSLINYKKESINNANISSFSQYHLIVLDNLSSIGTGLIQELKKFVDSGHSLSIFLANKVKLNEVNSLFAALKVDRVSGKDQSTAQLNELNVQSALYKNVFERLPTNIDLPKSSEAWIIEERNLISKENLLRFSNGKAALNKYKFSNGYVYLSALSLSDSSTNFTKHAIFVPTIYNMALQAVSTNPPLHFINEHFIPLQNIENSESPLRLVQNQIEFIPKQWFVNNELRLDLNSKITKAGHYKMMQGSQFIGWIGLNYNRKESEMKFLTVDEVKNATDISPLNIKLFDFEKETLTNEIIQSVEGKSLWKYFIILALVFLAIEILLLRFLK